MLKLKLQYTGHLTGRTDSLEKTLMLGKIEGRRRRRQQRMRCLDSITDLMETEETRNRLLLNQVISQQSVQWDTRGVLPLFHFYKIKPTGNTAHLGTG